MRTDTPHFGVRTITPPDARDLNIVLMEKAVSLT